MNETLKNLSRPYWLLFFGLLVVVGVLIYRCRGDIDKMAGIGAMFCGTVFVMVANHQESFDEPQ